MRSEYESFMVKRFGDLIDTRRAKNGDPENPDYFAWDMTVGWIAWQSSRATLVVELPEMLDYGLIDEQETKDALRAVGITVKDA